MTGQQWQGGGGQGFNPPPGFPQQQGQVERQAPAEIRMPQRGAFAMSETIPLIQQYATAMREAREHWEVKREEANRAKAHAKKTRADLMVRLRVFGNEETGGRAMKTAVERNEWADADSEVQQAELDADLAQTVQMSAREAYEEAARVFDTLRSMLGIERDDMKREHHGPHLSP